MGHPPRLPTAGLIACCLLLLVQPSYTSRCTVGCHGMHSDQSYKEGQTYTYALEGRSASTVSEGQGEATLKLNADVELAVKPDCVRQLRLKNVQVNGAAVPQQDLEKYALQFNYHHGHIDTELCAEAGDSQASLNIKRAVISLFQATVVQDEGSTTRHEVDILGGCVTDFIFSKDGDAQVVTKSRNLNQCSNRENIKQGLFSGIVNPNAGIQSTPIIAGHQKVEQRFKGGVLDKAVSTETYKLRPFSNGEAGAKTVVETVLTYKGKKEDSPTAAVSLPKSIIFEAPHPVVKSSVEAIDKAMQPIHKDASDAVKPEEARKFSELIRVLRTSSKKDILSVYHRIKAGAGYDKEKDKKVLLDALYRTGTGEAAEVVVELIKNKEITDLQAVLYYASLAFIQHVNLPSVTAITTLLDQPNLSRIGYLGIGQIIGRYCHQHSCENVPEIKNALAKIVAKVKDGKANNRADEDVIIAALKGLGNAKYLDDATLEKLANIAADKKVRNRVRVAAIEALPTRCTMAWKNILSKPFADQEEDSEIRNKIYLSFVACPCSKVAATVKKVLDNEKIYQVGSFITSHLRNLRASADPFKQHAKAHFGQIRPRTKFPEDFRKFSFNNEISYNLDAFGVGSTAESNVIYSQNSFVPRSASLNLTTEIFGHSFNFLELNTRTENLDRVIEHFFGPKGVIPSQKPQDAYKDGLKDLAGLSKYIKERLEKSTRGKRDVKQADLDKFAKGVTLRNNEVDADLDLDLSIKLFGVELAFLSYEGSSQAYTPQQIVDKLFDHFDIGVNKIKNLNHDVENHIHFLDAEFIYPTGLGVALNLGVTGSSVVRTKTNTKIDIPSILADPKNAAVRIALEPSASIEIVGDIIVTDGFGSQSGIRLVTTLHTATGYDLNVKVLDGKGVDVSLGVPKRKQEIISVSSDVLFSNGKPDKYTPIKFGKGKKRQDCFDQFTAPLGLTVCGHISYPYDNLASIQKKPFFPLSGPFKFYVTIENNDVSSYHFKAFYNDKNPKDRSVEILLETPNSRTSRYVSLLLQAATEPDAKLKVSFDSPIKKASAEALVKRNDKEQTLTVTVKNDQTEYFARAGVETLGGSKYKPILEYKVPDHFEKLGGGKGKAVGKSGQTHKVEGTVEVANHQGGKKYVFNDVKLLSNGHKIIGIEGTAISTPKSVEVDVDLGYADDKLKIKVDGKKLGEHNYELAASALPQKNLANSFGFDWAYNLQKNTWEHKFGFVQGEDLKSQNNRLELVQKAEFNVEPDKFALSSKNKVTYPKVGLVAKLNGELTKKSLKTEAELKYDKFKFGAELSGKINTNKPGDYEVEFEAEVLENKIELESKRIIVDENKSKFENSLKLSPGGTYKADAVIGWKVKKNDINVEVDADLNLNNKKIKLDTGLVATPEKLNNHAQMIANGVKYIDYNLKIQRGQNPNGNLVLNLKNYLTADGQFAYQNGKGNAKINVDIPKINRKIKGTGDIAVTGSKHVANFEIAYDAEKDPNKKIKISTDSDITKTSIDSKNVIEILTYKTVLNVKGNHKGDLFNGQQDGNIEITLPNGRYLTLKGDRVASKKDEKLDVKSNLEVTDQVTKGGETKKAIFGADVKIVNMKERLFDSVYTAKYVHSDGKDLTTKIAAKNLAASSPDKKSAALGINFSGTLIPHPIALSTEANYDFNNVAFKGTASRGSDLTVTSDVNYSRGNNVDKPAKLKGHIEAKLPSDKLKNIKMEFDESVLDQGDENGIFEYIKSKTITYNDIQKIKLDATYKHSGNKNLDESGKFERTFTSTLQILDKPAITLTENYNHDLSGELKNLKEKASVKYGDKEVTGDVHLTWNSEFNKVAVNGKFTTPFDKLKNIDFQVDHKSENEKSRKTDVVVTIDGVKYTQTSEIDLDETPGIHLVFTCPAGKTELLAKFKKLGDNEYSGEYKLITPKGFVTADGRVKLDSVDDFVLNVNFDSDKLKYRKIHAEIANKPSTPDGRAIFITVTSDGKNLVTGSTNYKRHEEDKKITLEGNGSLKIGENTKSSSFKYVRKQLTRENDKEVGVAIMLNASFGPSGIVGELKLSDKEVLVFNSYCEQSKDCAQFKLQSTLDTDHLTHLNHNLQVEVNLKKFNVPVEFGLMSSTKYADYSLDHQANLYLHSSKDRTQYTYHVYSNKRESAAVLSLPSRELAIVAFHDVPTVKHSGAYKIDISLYLDRKNKPSEKTSVIFAGDVNVDKNNVGIKGEAKFTYPSQPKDMIVKGNLNVGGTQMLDANVDIDVFHSKNDKITANAKLIRNDIAKGYNVTGTFNIHSKGQKLDVKSDQHFAATTNSVDLGAGLSYTDKQQKPKSLGAYFVANPQQVDLYVFVPGKELVKSHTNIVVGKDNQKVDTEFSILGHKPVAANLEVKDYNSFKASYGRKDDAKNKLTANGKIVIGQLAEIHADVLKNGAKEELFHVLVHLDESKFMKPDFAYNNKNIMAVVNHHREHLTERVKEIKQIGEEIGKEIVTEFTDLFEHLKKAQPSLKPLIAYFEGELNKLKTELHADQTIKEIQDILNKTFGGLIAAVTKSVKKFAEQLQELHEQLNNICSKLQEAVRATYPQLKESFDKLFQVGVAIFDSATKLATAYVEAILKVLNEHQKDIEELVSVASELAQDVAKIIFKGASQIEKEVREFVQLLVQQVRALPIYEMAQNTYKELMNYKIPDYIIAPVEEFCNNIKNFLPTQELKDFFSTVYNYVLKHVKHQKVDDTNEVKKIYSQAINAARSIIGLLQSHATVENVFGFLETQFPIDVSYLRKLPGLSTIRFSILKLLINRELPTISDLYYTYRPINHLDDTIPPARKYGYFADGGLFVTFDGKQFVFPGTCNYILAQDMKDGNFSVVGEYANGNLVSVTVTEPNESVTIKSNGNLLVNNKPADYPAATKNIEAHLSVPLRRVKSKYGVKVVCNIGSSMSCYLRVSGFYHDKLRGLLGNANNEPSDDYILPNGKVAASATDFGNGYKLNSGCGNAAAKGTDAPRSSVCTQYFSGKSSLNPCFNYVDSKIFRSSCDQLVANGVKNGPCIAASSYVSACLVQNILVSLPNDCVQCKVADAMINGGDSFSVKIPKKQADIIFVVEQAADNEKAFKELIKPVMNELRTELKQQGITDVFIGLIGFGEGMTWPRHYTSNNNVNIEGGDINHMTFTAKNEPLVSMQEAKEDKQGSKKLQFIKQRLDVELGTFKVTDAYEAAIRYPFRPAAAKAVVGLISQFCEKSPLSPFSFQDYRLHLGREVYNKMGLTYYHVSPLKDLEINGKSQKNVVGYDKDYVYTFADSKKKPLEGSSDLKSNLATVNGDVCAGFAVNTGGSAFSTHNFLEAKPNQQAQYVKVTARRIAEGLVNTEIEEDCVCGAEAGYGHTAQVVSRPHCKVVNRTEKERHK
ncbi:apolipophorins [Nasonia vitripennis]|uniref:Apolipophorins n=1 Tax=Nasonia vitripennis TaxID=7425 RepID=A0A7M7G5E8_NASVI|nr:apolipophorins [Nasonia vitripennis]